MYIKIMTVIAALALTLVLASPTVVYAYNVELSPELIEKEKVEAEEAAREGAAKAEAEKKQREEEQADKAQEARAQEERKAEEERKVKEEKEHREAAELSASQSREEAEARQCVVPSLKSKSLSQARHMLTKDHCRLGNVVQPRSHHGGTLVVIRQLSPVGTRLPNGSRVGVTLGVSAARDRR
ncbi:MAG TPA: hypothetical protein VGP18_08380 [Solirubrobacteraceae bacterium]|jgi:hypothetical protein|nr:hypothetical protein [Solirubrobacteraceae bacterium]